VKEVYEAIMDPANASPLASLFTPAESIEAADERTLELDMAPPCWKQAANADEPAAGNRFQTAIAEQPPIVHGWLPHQYDIYPLYNNVWLRQ